MVRKAMLIDESRCTPVAAARSPASSGTIWKDGNIRRRRITEAMKTRPVVSQTWTRIKFNEYEETVDPVVVSERGMYALRRTRLCSFLPTGALKQQRTEELQWNPTCATAAATAASSAPFMCPLEVSNLFTGRAKVSSAISARTARTIT